MRYAVRNAIHWFHRFKRQVDSMHRCVNYVGDKYHSVPLVAIKDLDIFSDSFNDCLLYFGYFPGRL